jgi:TolA-binding protein
MTVEVCARGWQVEAMLDGRLEGQEGRSFERHLGACSTCAAELAAQRALVEAMSALPGASRSELEHRRARLALLGAADGRLVGGARAPRARWSYWAGVPAALAGAALVAALVLGKSADAPLSAAAPAYEVRDVGAAVWTEETQGDRTTVALRDGKASFHVEHLEGSARFVVALPDGELEVRGTRFVVDVRGAQTRAVVVEEGVVALSVAGFSGLLGAGERWPVEEVAPAVEPSALAGEPVASSTPLPVAPERAPASAAPSARTPPSPRAGPRFAEAMAAYSSGDYGRADGLFAAFVRDFPRDGRSEDATFLRADARARRGDAAGAAAAAREYLRAYPRGLRRPEAGRLAGEAPGASGSSTAPVE